MATRAGPTSRGLRRSEGHQAGRAHLEADRARDAGDLGIDELTVYAFSTENWTAPRREVSGMMAMFVERIDIEAPELDEEGVRLRFIGRRDRISERLLEQIEWAERADRAPHRPHAVRGLRLRRARRDPGRGEALPGRRGGGVPRGSYAPDMQDPELIIRTSGEQRLSNFLLWESAYSELYFSDKMWPDFDREELERALDDYASRQCRFGGR